MLAGRVSRPSPVRPRLLINQNRVKSGNGDLCNPPGRGLGPVNTTQTGYTYADAFMWTHPPGNSSGCGGGPPGGVFWPRERSGSPSAPTGSSGRGSPAGRTEAGPERRRATTNGAV